MRQLLRFTLFSFFTISKGVYIQPDQSKIKYPNLSAVFFDHSKNTNQDFRRSIRRLPGRSDSGAHSTTIFDPVENFNLDDEELVPDASGLDDSTVPPTSSCDRLDCQNGGECIPAIPTAFCSCEGTGFKGSRCETKAAPDVSTKAPNSTPHNEPPTVPQTAPKTEPNPESSSEPTPEPESEMFFIKYVIHNKLLCINQKCPLEFADTSVLLASTEKHDAGQLAYTITEEKLFLRTKTAWRYVLLGDELGNESKKPENPEIATEKTTTKQPATTTEKQFQPIKKTDCPTDKTKKLRIYALNSLISPISLTKSSDLDSMCQNQSADLYKPITREKIKIRCRKIIKRNHGQSSRKTKKSVFRQCMRHKLQKTYLKPPTFKAVVSTHSQFISKLISRSNYKYPICNGDNKMVASSWPDFLEKAKGQGTVEVQAFDKKVYTEKTIVWHGSFSSGTQTESGIQKTAQIWGGHRSPLNQNLDCMQWTGSRNKHGHGLASDFIRYDQNTVSGFLKNPTKRSCLEKGIVYCIQINPEGSKKPHAG